MMLGIIAVGSGVVALFIVLLGEHDTRKVYRTWETDQARRQAELLTKNVWDWTQQRAKELAAHGISPTLEALRPLLPPRAPHALASLVGIWLALSLLLWVSASGLMFGLHWAFRLRSPIHVAVDADASTHPAVTGALTGKGDTEPTAQFAAAGGIKQGKVGTRVFYPSDAWAQRPDGRRVLTLPSATTATCPTALADVCAMTSWEPHGILDIAAPTGLLADGQRLAFLFRCVNTQRFRWDPVFVPRPDPIVRDAGLPSVCEGDFKSQSHIIFMYDATAKEWRQMLQSLEGLARDTPSMTGGQTMPLMNGSSQTMRCTRGPGGLSQREEVLLRPGESTILPVDASLGSWQCD